MSQTSLYIQRAPLLLAALVAGACGQDTQAKAPAADAPVSVGVENVAVVALDRIETGPAISGSLRPEVEAAVRAQVGGSVLQTYVEKGQAVSAGTPLVRIDDTVVRDAVLSAQSGVRTAEQALAVARRNAERAEALAQAGAIAEREVEGARVNVTSVQGQLADARARLAQARKQQENTVVRSPISGIVSDRPVNAGDVVAPGAPLVTVIDPSRMRLDASVPSEQLGQVRVGAPVRFTVSGYPGRAFEGRIDRLNPAADPLTRQVQIYVSVPNAGGALVAGLFAQGRVAAESREALVVPSGAVDERGVQPSVLRVRNGRTERVPVKLGMRQPDGDRVEVLSGVAVGDTVLTGAALGTSPNVRVRVGAPARR